MKKVIFADRTYVIIEDSQEAGVERKLNGTAKFRLNHMAGSDLVDPKEVRRVTNAVAGQDYSPPDNRERIDTNHRLADKNKLTDEEREANLQKIEKIKAKIRKDLEQRKAKNG